MTGLSLAISIGFALIYFFAGSREGMGLKWAGIALLYVNGSFFALYIPLRLISIQPTLSERGTILINLMIIAVYGIAIFVGFHKLRSLKKSV